MSKKKIDYALDMTLRDWFAGQALAGLTSSAEATPDLRDARLVCRVALQTADAMMEARKEKGGAK